jgi:hypothetical protein
MIRLPELLTQSNNSGRICALIEHQEKLDGVAANK